LFNRSANGLDNAAQSLKWQYAGFYWLPACWLLIQFRDVQIAVSRESERSWDRRGCHD